MLLCDNVPSEAWTNMYLDNETMTDKIKPTIKVHCCDLKSLLELLIGVCLRGCYRRRNASKTDELPKAHSSVVMDPKTHGTTCSRLDHLSMFY